VVREREITILMILLRAVGLTNNKTPLPVQPRKEGGLIWGWFSFLVVRERRNKY
jgi:hypothetical protein